MGDVAQEEETETEHFGDRIQIDQVGELLQKTCLWTKQERKEAGHFSDVFGTLWGLTNNSNVELLYLGAG